MFGEAAGVEGVPAWMKGADTMWHDPCGSGPSDMGRALDLVFVRMIDVVLR